MGSPRGKSQALQQGYFAHRLLFCWWRAEQQDVWLRGLKQGIGSSSGLHGWLHPLPWPVSTFPVQTCLLHTLSLPPKAAPMPHRSTYSQAALCPPSGPGPIDWHWPRASGRTPSSAANVLYNSVTTLGDGAGPAPVALAWIGLGSHSQK